MFFCNKKEVDYEYIYYQTMNKIILNNTKYSNIHKIKIPTIMLFFNFNEITEDKLNMIHLFDHKMLFWLLTQGISGKIKKVNSYLKNGIRYFSFIYYVIIDKTKSFQFINFLNEIFKITIYKQNIKIVVNEDNKIILSINNLSSFTNFKLSKNIYLNSIYQKLHIMFYNSINLKEFLKFLKIY